MTEAYRPATGPTSTGVMTGWVGWIVFGAFMLIMLGFVQAIQGLVAIFDPGYYLVGPEGLVVNVDYTVWGWTHLIVGLIAIAAGIGLFVGNMAARVVGVILAVVSAVLNLAFIAAYPLWSTIVIAVDYNIVNI